MSAPLEVPGTRDRRALRAEAERIREQVRTLKQQIKVRPQDGDLREEYDRLRARYQRIEQILTQPAAPHAAPPGPSAPAQSAPPSTAQPMPPAESMPLAIDPALLEPRPAAPPVRRRASAGISLDWETVAGYLVGGVKSVRILITSALLLFVLVFGYLYFVQDMRFFIVPTRSMQPTLNPMDRIATVKAAPYQRGDIVVFPDPENPGDFLAKRVVGVGGDVVEVRGGALHINGQLVREPYIAEPMEFGMHAYEVPTSEVFVLGDNRNESEDSKDWARGVPVADIRGRVWAIYMPLDRFQGISRAGGFTQ